MNVLILYESTQTFTNTIYDHLLSFANYSKHRIFYAHANQLSVLNLNPKAFDAIGLHYSIRVPFGQISPSMAECFQNFDGLKFLFIQDEYDYTKRAWYWIKRLGFQLVFTSVPQSGIEKIYPKMEFPNVRFVNNLTGYVPDELPVTENILPPSMRNILVGYRGRPLPIRYGQLGIEKVQVGQVVRAYCQKNGFINDIAWSEEDRIYGSKWNDFVYSVRSMLGSESGSNVFDWDGDLNKIIADYRELNPKATDAEIYEKIVKPRELDGLMNQVSPKVFEAISKKTVLILYEGNYSNVLTPWEHYMVLKKDGSNLDEVFRLLQDGNYLDAMAERAFNSVVASGKYSYRKFVSMVDLEWESAFNALEGFSRKYTLSDQSNLTQITTLPIRAKPYTPLTMISLSELFWGSSSFSDLIKRLGYYFWSKLPVFLRLFLQPIVKRILGKG